MDKVPVAAFPAAPGEFAPINRHAQAIVTRYDPVRHRHIADLLTVDPKTGWIFQLGGNLAAAEAAFRASLDASRQQHAKSWALRAATSYAKLLKDQNRHKDALEVLEPIYLWFTEGFATKNLKEAKAMLEELR